ncbi:MAG: calcium-binding protein, partial [Limnoraphis sp.]
DGNEGNDIIFGGQGDDFIGDIGGGNDQFFSNLGNDLINGGEGNDQVFGGQGDDFVVGGAGNDLVSGDKGSDILIGVDFENTINPGFGEIDTLVGGEGRDLFTLGFDSPSYYVGLGDSDFALITNFNLAEDAIFVSETDNVTISDINRSELGSGTGIFSENGDLIGFIQGVAANQLTFDINFIRS